MATSMKKATPAVAKEVIEAEVVETVAAELVETEPAKVKEKRKFKETDPIECVSITAGTLGMVGIKTGINYRWAGRNDVTEVEYQDLVAAIRSGKKHITNPCFIIKDADFLAEFPQVNKIYDSMFSMNDLKDVFQLPAAQMKKVIVSLPAGAQESIKHIASNMISNGSLDSVSKIKALDEIFDTKFMLMTELFG